MNNPFEIQVVEAKAGVTVLRVQGRLDAHAASTLMEHCNRVREAGQHLVLNLSGVPFIASSGIGALLALFEEFRQGSQTVRLAEVSPAVESVVRLLNLDQFLEMDASEQVSIEVLKAA
jgi:stage II sporulation protein AA (anti-sigma F factor antagonist)